MKKFSFGLIFILAIIFCLQPAGAQNITKDSYEKAKKLLDESIVAYGGIEKVRSMQNFSIRAEGDYVFRNQSRRPDSILDRAPLRYDYTADLKNERYWQIYKTKFPGAVAVDLRRVFDGKELIIEDQLRKTKTKVPALVGWRNRIIMMPQLVLLNAYERAQRLRYLGTTTFNNRPHEVVSYTGDDGQQNSLYIDRETRLLSKLEWMFSDAVAGDVVSELIFPAHKTIGDFKVPTGRITKTAGEITQELRYSDVKINSALTDEEFKLNPEFRMAVQPSAGAPPVTKLAENVYTISVRNYNMLFINFKDYIWVMEAPGGDDGSREAIAKIKETIPGKPIKYLTVTHYHDDHAGGVRTYVSEGATLVTTRGNRDYFERNMKSVFTIAPDTLTKNPNPLKMEFLEGEKRIFTDGTQTVEIYNIGPNPHAEEMLVAYLPKEKILFEADIFDGPTGDDLPLAFESTVHFAEWLEKKKFPVEKILPVHGNIMTMNDLSAAVKEREKTQK